MKRFFSLILVLVLMSTVIPAAFAAEGPAVSSNRNDHWYVNAQRWSTTVKSAFYPNEAGWERVEYIGDALVIEQYDPEFRFVSGKTLELELPIYGGVYHCDDYNFLVVGQTNLEENDEKEVFRIIRYSSEWVRQDSAGIYGANTTIPFDAGSLRFDRSGDILYIRTCHEMYTSEDGLNHQANVMIALRISDMTVTDQLTKVWNNAYGYVSHSFNQFVRVDGSTLLAVDHGDAYPRSVALMKYGAAAGSETFYSRVALVNALPIVDSTYHYNDTGVSVGGFEFSSTHYLIAGSSGDQTVAADLMEVQRNIFVTATPKDDFTDTGTVCRWLTNYTEEDDASVSPPHLVKLSDNRFFLAWTEGELLHYCFLDGTGTPEGNIYTREGSLSDCVPVVYEGKIYWYVTDYSEPVFYCIDPENPDADSNPHTHDYTAVTTPATCTQAGYTTYTCSDCGYSYTAFPVDALGHNQTEATCTEASVCTRCQEILSPALGHDMEPWVLVWEPTCQQDGLQYRQCQRCYEGEQNVLDALPHDYQNGYCSVCGQSESGSQGPDQPFMSHVVRIAGSDRIETSLMLADQLKEVLGVEKFDSVIVASALNFPDALTGSYLAAVKNAPILLTYEAAHAQVRAYIQENLIPGGMVYILGGEGAVSASFASGLNGFNVKRVAGSDRFGTNLEIMKEAGVRADQPVLIATAINFADSLSASAAGLPMVLVYGSLRPDQKEFLATTSRNFIIIGGTSAVSEELEAELRAIGSVERLAGAGRYQTSVMVAQKFVQNPDDVVLAYARNFPDGLCGGPLAYALGAPLILTDNYDPTTADAYVEGIIAGIVVGGDGLISDASARAIFDLAADAVINAK